MIHMKCQNLFKKKKKKIIQKIFKSVFCCSCDMHFKGYDKYGISSQKYSLWLFYGAIFVSTWHVRFSAFVKQDEGLFLPILPFTENWIVVPFFCRIRTETNGGAWCPKTTISRDSYEYLQIDLAKLTVITMVEIQGRFGNGQVSVISAVWTRRLSRHCIYQQLLVRSAPLMLIISFLGKISSRWLFLIFSRKQDLTFHANQTGDSLQEMSNPVFWKT